MMKIHLIQSLLAKLKSPKQASAVRSEFGVALEAASKEPAKLPDRNSNTEPPASKPAVFVSARHSIRHDSSQGKLKQADSKSEVHPVAGEKQTKNEVKLPVNETLSVPTSVWQDLSSPLSQRSAVDGERRASAVAASKPQASLPVTAVKLAQVEPLAVVSNPSRSRDEPVSGDIAPAAPRIIAVSGVSKKAEPILSPVRSREKISQVKVKSAVAEERGEARRKPEVYEGSKNSATRATSTKKPIVSYASPISTRTGEAKAAQGIEDRAFLPAMTPERGGVRGEELTRTNKGVKAVEQNRETTNQVVREVSTSAAKTGSTGISAHSNESAKQSRVDSSELPRMKRVLPSVQQRAAQPAEQRQSATEAYVGSTLGRESAKQGAETGQSSNKSTGSNLSAIPKRTDGSAGTPTARGMQSSSEVLVSTRPVPLSEKSISREGVAHRDGGKIGSEPVAQSQVRTVPVNSPRSTSTSGREVSEASNSTRETISSAPKVDRSNTAAAAQSQVRAAPVNSPRSTSTSGREVSEASNSTREVVSSTPKADRSNTAATHVAVKVAETGRERTMSVPLGKTSTSATFELKGIQREVGGSTKQTEPVHVEQPTNREYAPSRKTSPAVAQETTVLNVETKSKETFVTSRQSTTPTHVEPPTNRAYTSLRSPNSAVAQETTVLNVETKPKETSVTSRQSTTPVQAEKATHQQRVSPESQRASAAVEAREAIPAPSSMKDELISRPILRAAPETVKNSPQSAQRTAAVEQKQQIEKTKAEPKAEVRDFQGKTERSYEKTQVTPRPDAVTKKSSVEEMTLSGDTLKKSELTEQVSPKTTESRSASALSREPGRATKPVTEVERREDARPKPETLRDIRSLTPLRKSADSLPAIPQEKSAVHRSSDNASAIIEEVKAASRDLSAKVETPTETSVQQVETSAIARPFVQPEPEFSASAFRTEPTQRTPEHLEHKAESHYKSASPGEQSLKSPERLEHKAELPFSEGKNPSISQQPAKAAPVFVKADEAQVKPETVAPLMRQSEQSSRAASPSISQQPAKAAPMLVKAGETPVKTETVTPLMRQSEQSSRAASPSAPAMTSEWNPVRVAEPASSKEFNRQQSDFSRQDARGAEKVSNEHSRSDAAKNDAASQDSVKVLQGSEPIREPAAAPKLDQPHAQKSALPWREIQARVEQALEQSRRRIVEPDHLNLSFFTQELGSFEIDIVRRQDRLSIRVEGESNVVTMMEDEKLQLVQWMRDQGYQVERVEFSSKHESANAFHRDSQPQNQERSEQLMRGSARSANTSVSGQEELVSGGEGHKPQVFGQRVWTA